MATMEVSVLLRVIDRATSKLKGVTATLQKMQKLQEKGQMNLKKAFFMKEAGRNIKGYGDALFNMLKKPLAVATEFQSAMAQVKGKATLTGEEFQNLSEFAGRMGDTTRFSGIQAAEGLGFFATAGLGYKDMMVTLKPAMDLATAASTDLGRSADVLTDIMGAFRIPTSKATETADTLSRAFTGSNTTLETLFNTIKMAGPIMKDYNVDLKEAATLAGVLGGAGVKGTRAGTALRTFFARLTSPRGEVKKVLDFLKVDVADTEGNLRPVFEILDELRTKTEKMGTVRRGGILNLLFGTEGMTGVSILQGSLGPGGVMDQMRASMAETGKTAASIAEIIGAPTKATKEYESAVEGLNRKIGTHLKPTYTKFIKLLTVIVTPISEWIDKNPKLTNTLVVMAAGVAAVTVAVGSFLLALGALVALKGTLLVGLGVIGGAFLTLTTAVSAVGTALAVVGPTFLVIAAGVGVMVAPVIAATAAFTALGLAVHQLVTNWERLNAAEGFKGILQGITSEGMLPHELLLGTAKTAAQLFDPRTLISDLTSTPETLTPLKGGAGGAGADGKVTVEVIGPGRVVETVGNFVEVSDPGFTMVDSNL